MRECGIGPCWFLFLAFLKLRSITGWLAQTQTDDPPPVFGGRFLRRMQRHPPHPTQAGGALHAPITRAANWPADRGLRHGLILADFASDSDRILRLPELSFTAHRPPCRGNWPTPQRLSTPHDRGPGHYTDPPTLGRNQAPICLASTNRQSQSWQQIRP